MVAALAAARVAENLCRAIYTTGSSLPANPGELGAVSAPHGRICGQALFEVAGMFDGGQARGRVAVVPGPGPGAMSPQPPLSTGGIP